MSNAREQSPFFADDSVTLWHGDCLDVMATLPDASVDAVVTDPPYGLGFMGKAWDATFIDGTVDRRRRYPGDPSPKAGENGGYRSAAAEAGRYDLSLTGNRAFGAWCEQWTAECLRVLKPGGYLLAFGGSRTWHRLACAVEDAGFEVRDSIAWLYGSGFPKSLDVSKAIDKAAGAEPIVLGPDEYRRARANRGTTSEIQPSYDKPRVSQAEANLTAPATEAAARWQGWGTALKPAFEPIVVARKPLVGTVAGNVLAHDTGALNIDGCRISAGQDYRDKCASVVGLGSNRNGDAYGEWTGARQDSSSPAGRWPTNVVLDGHAADELDRQSGTTRDGVASSRSGGFSGGMFGDGTPDNIGAAGFGGQGGASRFFPTFRYEAKAPTAERPRHGDVAHPTVKPLDLMRWLVRLVTPPGGTVLEPFAGSGTTAEACVIEGFRCIAIEREAAYLPLITARLSKPIQPDLFGGAA